MRRTGLEWEKIPETAQMTWQTYQALQDALSYAAELVTNAGKAIGESADPGDWHENYAFEQAHRDHDMAIALKDWLHNLVNTHIAFIDPRQEVDTVGIGNQVTLQDKDKKEEPHTLTLLSTFDVRYGPKEIRPVSIDTPVGQAILGKRAGDIVTTTVINANEILVHHWQIVDIQPGRFPVPPQNPLQS